MNCHEFDDVVYALAEPENQTGGTGDPDEFLDDATWREAVAHAESCLSCARLLTDARSLRAGLTSLGAAERALEAPARIESLLLSQFEKHKGGETRGARSGSPSGTWRARWVSWKWGMAAMAVIAPLLMAGWHARNRPRPSPDIQERSNAHSQAPSSVETSRSESWHERVPAGQHSRQSPTRKAESTSNPSAAAEDSTAFLPLEYDGDPSNLSQADLVRVELPQSALAYFGLGVGDDPTGTVTAELLVSEDGTPEAVRFLR